MPATLHQAGSAANDQRLGETQLHYAEQNEQEIHRHGAVDARQLHLQSRGQDRDRQVAEKSWQVVRLPVPKGITERNHARGRGEADEELRLDR